MNEFVLTEDAKSKKWGLYNTRTKQFTPSPDQSNELKQIYSMLMSNSSEIQKEGRELWEDYMHPENCKYYICKLSPSGNITLLSEIKVK